MLDSLKSKVRSSEKSDTAEAREAHHTRDQPGEEHRDEALPDYPPPTCWETSTTDSKGAVAVEDLPSSGAAKLSRRSPCAGQDPADLHRQYKGKGSSQTSVAIRYGVTPEQPYERRPQDTQQLPLNHPVHKVPPEVQEKMRKKGINPVLRAEMDAAAGKSEGKGFWVTWAGASGDGGWMGVN